MFNPSSTTLITNWNVYDQLFTIFSIAIPPPQFLHYWLQFKSTLHGIPFLLISAILTFRLLLILCAVFTPIYSFKHLVNSSIGQIHSSLIRFLPITLYQWSRQSRVGLRHIVLNSSRTRAPKSLRWRCYPAARLHHLCRWSRLFLPSLSRTCRWLQISFFQPIWLNGLLSFRPSKFPLMKMVTTNHSLRSHATYLLFHFLMVAIHGLKPVSMISTTVREPITWIEWSLPFTWAPTSPRSDSFRREFRPLPLVHLLRALMLGLWLNFPLLTYHQPILTLFRPHLLPQHPFSYLKMPTQYLPLDLSPTFRHLQRKLNSLLLPVYSDLIFRLQYNGLGCR